MRWWVNWKETIFFIRRKQTIGRIVSGPFYKGVVSFGDGYLTLSVIDKCSEKNYHYVQRKLNREIYLLLTQNGIKV